MTTFWERHRSMQKFKGTPLSALMLWIDEQRREAVAICATEDSKTLESSARVSAAVEVLQELQTVERVLDAFQGQLLAEVHLSRSNAYPAHPQERGKQPPGAAI